MSIEYTREEMLEARESALQQWRATSPDWLIAQFLLEEPGSWWRDREGLIYSLGAIEGPSPTCPLGWWVLSRVECFHPYLRWAGSTARFTPASASQLFTRLHGEPSEDEKIAHNVIHGMIFRPQIP